MITKPFPVIDPVATGANIVSLRKERNLSVRDLQQYFGFEEPQAIYKWQKGKSLPTVDNLLALSVIFEVPVEQILIHTELNNISNIKQQGANTSTSAAFNIYAACSAAMREPRVNRFSAANLFHGFRHMSYA